MAKLFTRSPNCNSHTLQMWTYIHTWHSIFRRHFISNMAKLQKYFQSMCIHNVQITTVQISWIIHWGAVPNNFIWTWIPCRSGSFFKNQNWQFLMMPECTLNPCLYNAKALVGKRKYSDSHPPWFSVQSLTHMDEEFGQKHLVDWLQC